MAILPPRPIFGGVASPWSVATAQIDFFLFLDHLPGFPNYTFLNFQKKFFSLHPSLQTVLLKRQAVIPAMIVMKARVTLSLVVYSRNKSAENPVMQTEWKLF